MKYFIVLIVAGFGVADRLDHVQLPPNAGAAGGPSAGLQTPLGGNHNHAAANAETLHYENEINEKGYNYAYETSNGIKAEQQGRIVPGAKPEEGTLNVQGSYSYVGEDGQTFLVSYVADDKGFRADGAHLPTPPSVPDHILRSAQQTDTKSDQYSSRKSSYDADAGFKF